MHSATHHEFEFHYNGDYSGEIVMINQQNIENRKTFQQLVVTALYDSMELPYTQAAREFVAFAAVNEAISRLEQMEPDQILANPWLRDILEHMTTN